MIQTYKAVLILSVGVTATTLSTHPAIIPARMPDDLERCPLSSARAFLMESNVRNRTDALKAVPMTNVEHPVYNAEMPSFLTMSRTRVSGFFVVIVAVVELVDDRDGRSRSWSRVLANSNGYFRVCVSQFMQHIRLILLCR